MGGAPEWRRDPLTGRLALISPDRAERPLKPGAFCPFCEGHESETPPEVLATRAPDTPPDGPGWRVRVVPNRYAAVRLDAGGGGRSPNLPVHPAGSETCRHDSTPGVGVAEVFIECPHHETKFRNLSRSHAEEAVRAWRDRLRFWRSDGRLGFALVFKNEGRLAGASVEHCHSQLIGTPNIPDSVRHEQGVIYNAFDRENSCPLCEDLNSQAALRDRLVAESPRFVAICPPAPRTAGETWLCPREDRSHFDNLVDAEIGELTGFVCDVLTRIARVFADPDLNLIVKSAPFKTGGLYHWRIEILPRTAGIAGWELGTGIFINTLFPEDAARLLRDAA